MNLDNLNKWQPAAWALPSPVEPLRAPFHILAGEALDVARFCQRNWDPSGARPEQQNPRPGLKSAVNSVFTANIAQEILELHDALQAAQTKYRLLVDAPAAGPVDRSQYVIGEIRSVLEWAFDDGKSDSADTQLAALATAHDGANSQDALAAALFDYAELAEQHKESISGQGGFDLKLIDEARELGTKLRELSAGAATVTPLGADREALELRNRLGMLLYDRMQRVRTAARFVFRHEPGLVREVTSTYARKQRAAHRKAPASPTPVAPTPVAPTPVVAATPNGQASAPVPAPGAPAHS